MRRAAFTIVELLIVIVVIAILAAIAFVSYSGIQASARDSSRDSAVRTLRTALELYKEENGGLYPNVCGAVNSGCATTSLAASLVPTYISTIPLDPQPGTTIDYVVASGQIGYGLLVRYEAKPMCKVRVGSNTQSGWWGSGVPTC